MHQLRHGPLLRHRCALISNTRRSQIDLFAALTLHAVMLPLWLILAEGVGESLPASVPANPLSIAAGWTLIGILPCMWVALAAMLVRWWRQGRGPLWSYPLRWGLALGLTFITLVALCFRQVRSELTPPAATAR